MTSVTGGVALVRQLVAEDVDTLFTLPGVQLDWAFDALRTEGAPIRAIVPRHEQATTYMADGYARVSGKVGVAMVVPGPGVLNAMSGLATAYACNTRVLMLAGQIRSGKVGQGLGLLHEVRDQAAILGSATKATFSVTSRAAVTSTLTDAFRALRSGRPRPVAVEIPHDLLQATAEADEHRGTAGRDAASDLPWPDIREAAAALSGARFPVIYVGGGVIAADASSELLALAEKLGAAIVMNDNGSGAVSDRHPLALTSLGGQRAFREADVALIVGSRFVDTLSGQPSWTGASTRLIALNADAADLGPPRSYATTILADAKHGLAALADAVTAHRDLSRPAAVTEIKRWQADEIRALGVIAEYVSVLREAIPDDGILVNELTQVGYLSRVAFPVYGPRTLLGPGYQGTLGYGYSTALGAAIGRPKARVVSIMGDGGFGWTLQELATAARYAIPVTLVLFVDGQFGNVRALQTAQFGVATQTELRNPDFLKLADAFGVQATSVESPAGLRAELAASAGTAGPSLIVVGVGQMASPWAKMRLQPG